MEIGEGSTSLHGFDLTVETIYRQTQGFEVKQNGAKRPKRQDSTGIVVLSSRGEPLTKDACCKVCTQFVPSFDPFVDLQMAGLSSHRPAAQPRNPGPETPPAPTDDNYITRTRSDSNAKRLEPSHRES